MAVVFGPDVFTAAGAGAEYQRPDLGVIYTLTAALEGTGAVSADLALQGSNDGVRWHNVGNSLALTGSAPQIGNFTRVQFAFAQWRVNVTNITGTGATLTTHLAVAS